MATAEFSKFADILSATLSHHHLLGFKIASGGDEIPAELFQIQQDDTDTVLPSVCQQVELSASWKNLQWP